MRVGLVDNRLYRPKYRWAQRIVALGKPRIAAIGSEQELGEVVRPDRNEVKLAKELVKLPDDRRNLDHRPKLDCLGQHMAARCNVLLLAFHELLGGAKLFDFGDHWEHHPEVLP